MVPIANSHAPALRIGRVQRGEVQCQIESPDAGCSQQEAQELQQCIIRPLKFAGIVNDQPEQEVAGDTGDGALRKIVARLHAQIFAQQEGRDIYVLTVKCLNLSMAVYWSEVMACAVANWRSGSWYPIWPWCRITQCSRPLSRHSMAS